MLGASAEAGTGWAIAKTLAAAGAKVVVGARRLSELQARASTIGATAVVCDAGQESQVKDLAEAALRTYGRLDIAVNAAFSAVGSSIADASRRNADRAHRGQLFRQRLFRQAYGKGDGTRMDRSCSFPPPRRRTQFCRISPMRAPRPLWIDSCAMQHSSTGQIKSGSIQFSRVRYGPKRHARSGPVREWSNCSLAMYR